MHRPTRFAVSATSPGKVRGTGARAKGAAQRDPGQRRLGRNRLRADPSFTADIRPDHIIGISEVVWVESHPLGDWAHDNALYADVQNGNAPAPAGEAVLTFSQQLVLARCGGAKSK